MLLKLFTLYLSGWGEEFSLIELLCYTHAVLTVADLIWKGGACFWFNLYYTHSVYNVGY